MNPTVRLIADILHVGGEPTARILGTVRPSLRSHFEEWLEARREADELKGRLADALDAHRAAVEALQETLELLADDLPKRAQQIVEAALKGRRP